MAAELVAVVFGGANTAARQLAGLRTSRDAPWLAKVAVVEHLGSGQFAVGAGTAVSLRNVGASDPLLQYISNALPPNSSALVLPAGTATAEQLVSAVAAKGKVVRHKLEDDQIKSLITYIRSLG
jgi:uncharacterized membrane protein